MKKHIYIDGLNLFMRHFAANPKVSLLNKQCGGIIGFLNNIVFLCKKFNPEKIIVAWEGGGSTRRRNLDQNYKNGRRPRKLNRNENYYDAIYSEKNNNDDIDDQLQLLIKILYKTQITQIYVDDCEADDIISYLVKTKSEQDINKIIVTSDKDYYQLLDENITIWSPNRKIMIDDKFIKENYNVYPQNFITMRCFDGDINDGLKGVKGVGFKVLLKRIPKLTQETFISVNEIIDHALKEVNSGSKLCMYKNIVDEQEQAKLNWKLMYLDSSMLSADQIKKINFQYENKEKSINKIELLKIINREGLNDFDVHEFFLILKINLKD